ncbi:DUF1771-domain-containing protein [Schizopora paradoxa]|uniref:DUF1771-domain-containing protein n=1 Tax=Schizopora paradoxa TaxID=27342 RepID=A0A0H2S399_9AGAM|nr:DUF1771-domain-containing protein [Schizopora paradoxa]
MASVIYAIVNFIFKALCGAQKGDEEQAGPRPPQQQQQEWQQQPQAPISYPPQQQQRPEQHVHKPQQHQGPLVKPHNDYLANSSDQHYTSLRSEAREKYAQMGSCFERSRAVYSSGDGAGAKSLSDEGHALQAEARRLDAQAADWIFKKNNEGREGTRPMEVDLHGLFVKEAVDKTETAVREAKRAGDRELKLIVGKGLHSENHVAKIKPAIEELMQKENLTAEIDPSNAGVLIVYLDGQAQGRGTAMGAEEISRQLAEGGDSKNCIIM